MDSRYLKKQLIGEIEEAMRVKELSMQLMEQLAYMGHWLLNYCNNHEITPSNTERLLELIQASKKIMNDIYEPYRRSDGSLHPYESDGDLTLPSGTILISLLGFYEAL
jgi:hypothetical protein